MGYFSDLLNGMGRHRRESSEMKEVTIQKQQEFYQQRWSGYRYIGVYKQKRLLAIIEELSRTGVQQPRMLDAGCGSGWLTLVLSHFGPVVGVDITPLILANARRRSPAVDFVAADGRAFPFKSGAFDVVISQEVLEHIVEQTTYVQNIARCLRPGGYLLLTTPNGDLPECLVPKDQPIEEYVGRRQLRRLLDDYFTIEKLTTIIPCFSSRLRMHPLNWRLLKGVASKLGCLEWLEKLQERMLRGAHFLVVARRRTTFGRGVSMSRERAPVGNECNRNLA